MQRKTPEATDRSSRRSLSLPWAFRAVLRRWYVLVTAIVVSLGLSYGLWSAMPTTYSATARLAYSPSNLTGLVGRDLFTNPSVEEVGAKSLAIGSPATVRRVSERPSVAATPSELLEMLSVLTYPELGVVDIQVRSEDRANSALLANLFAEEYVELRREWATSVVRQTRDSLGMLLGGLTEEQAATAYGVELRESYRELGLQLQLQRGDFEQLQEALVPLSPSSPGPVISLAVGLLVGTLAGLGLALLLESRDTRVRTLEEVGRELSLPVLSVLPPDKRWWRRGGDNPRLGFRNDLPKLDAYRNLFALLAPLEFGGSLRKLLVTSAVPSEGKTSTSINLALKIASSGGKVLLIDADMHRPQVHSYLQMPERPGLAEVLAGSISWIEAAIDVDFEPLLVGEHQWGSLPRPEEDGTKTKVSVITGGIPGDDSFHLLEAGALRESMEHLGGEWSHVIIDGPPLLRVADAINVLDVVDGVLFLARVGRVRRGELEEAHKLMVRNGGQPVGVVATGAYRQAKRSPIFPEKELLSEVTVSAASWDPSAPADQSAIEEVEARLQRLEMGQVPWSSDQ